MANILEPEDITWKFIASLNCSDCHHSKLINEEFGLEMEQITNVGTNGHHGKCKKYYFITGQEKEYTNLEELCKDWNEIKNFDDPNNEIVWVKKIVPVMKLNDF